MLHAPTSDTKNDATAKSAWSPESARKRHRYFATGAVYHASSTASGPNDSDNTQSNVWTKAQSLHGNQAVLRMLNRSTISSVPLLHRKCACEGSGADCDSGAEKKEGVLHRSAASHAQPNGVPPIVHDVLRSPGQPLAAATRAFMEPRFGYDFSGVRLHTDDRAAESARAVNARAYTVGNHVVLGAGQYSPEASSTQRLLAHELAHVIQQSSFSSFQGFRISSSGDPLERQADVAAEAVMADQSSPTLSSTAGTLQREEVCAPLDDACEERKKQEEEKKAEAKKPQDPTSLKARAACPDICSTFPAFEIAPNRFFALCDDNVQKLPAPSAPNIPGCGPGSSKAGVKIGLDSGGWIMPKNCYVCDGPGVSKNPPSNVQLGYIQTLESSLTGGVYFKKNGDKWDWASNKWLCTPPNCRDGFPGAAEPWYGPQGKFGPVLLDGSCPELEDSPKINLPALDANANPLRRIRIDQVFHVWLIAIVGTAAPVFIHHWKIQNWVVAVLKDGIDDPCSPTSWTVWDMKAVPDADKGTGQGSATPTLKGKLCRDQETDCSTKSTV